MRKSNQCRRIIRKLRRFNIPRKLRRAAAVASKVAEDAVQASIEFAREHKHLTACVILGAICALLLAALGVATWLISGVAIAALLAGLIIELKAEFKKA